MRGMLFWAMLSMLLVGCASQASNRQAWAGVPVQLSAEQERVVREGVVKVLKDPESARFGNMYGSQRADGTIAVCGYVNAKNSYGGYTGLRPFGGMLGGKPSSEQFVVAMMASGNDHYSVVTTCHKYGISQIS